MAEPKTKPTNEDPGDFLKTIESEQKRIDSFKLLEVFEKITGEKPKMWGSAIIGFGMYHYKSERSSQEGDWPLTGFSPRKANLTLYLMGKFTEEKELLQKLGKHKTSKACLYINKLSDIDIKVLGELIKRSYNQMKSVNTKVKTQSDLPQKLGAPADRALNNANIKNLNDLTKYTFKEISDLHGIGPNALSKLNSELRTKGISFKK